MISKDKDDKLIRIYFFICDKFEELQFNFERFCNNNSPVFTYQEIMTIYLYTMHHEGHFKVKHIHRFASEYLRSWFPKIGSHQAFNHRLNRPGSVLAKIVDLLITDYQRRLFLEPEPDGFDADHHLFGKTFRQSRQVIDKQGILPH